MPITFYITKDYGNLFGPGVLDTRLAKLKEAGGSITGIRPPRTSGLSPRLVGFCGQERDGGSTDVGDVSWNTLMLHVSVTTAPVGTPWHSWPVVACGGMSIGHKGMIHGAKTLSATMIDLFDNSETLATIQA